MKTYFQTKEDAQQSRNWLVVDAAGVPLGRLATEVATLIRGKHKATYTPHVDGGDFVVVTNAEKVNLKGNKKADKLYRWYTGYIGGLKQVTAATMLEKNPERVIEKAVKGMLPRGPLGRAMFTKLKVYSGEDHPHTAQKPEKYEFKFAGR